MKSGLLLKKILTSVLITLTLVCALFLCTSCNLNDKFLGNNTSDNNDYGFEELLRVMSQRYIGQFDEEELMIAAKRAIVDSLDDNWSFYMTAEEFEQYMQNSDNTYQGIGVEVEVLDEDHEIGGMKVTNVYSNSGAHAAGIVIGDIITAIDGENIRGYSIIDIRALLRRPLEATAVITVYRADGKYADINVVYSYVFQTPVTFEMLPGDIGYVRLSDFEGGSGDAFIEAVDTLISQGAKAFIYDVRSNYGGRVVEMTKMLDYLLPEGVIFIAVNDKGEESVTHSDEEFIDLPAVVLVNSHSYSGAEYFTATLSEFGYAATVGEQTTGKNRMQTTIPLSDGSALHISTGMFLTPNHIDLFEQGGYTPDYIIELTQEQLIQFYSRELSFDDDPQLQKALELLNLY